MTTIAQQELKRLIAVRGERAVAHAVGLSERRLRDVADGAATPRASTRKRMAEALQIALEAWTAEPESPATILDALDRAAPANDEAPGLIERLTTLRLDREVSWSDRVRAASIALRLAGTLPPTPSWEARYRFSAFVTELMAADELLADTTESHEEAAMAVPTSPADEILAWAQSEAARPDTPKRAVVMLAALEVRARKAAQSASDGAPNLLLALATDVIKRHGPISPEVAAVFERYGIESRPLAPAWLNPNYPLYRRECAERGWRPRDANA